MTKSFSFLIYVIALMMPASAVFAQDPSIKELQADANKEIKKQKIDSGKTWKTGGLFTLNVGAGQPKQLGSRW